MFDFLSTLEKADDYACRKEYALATFHYWLINFAFEDEEYPYHYTKEIGERGRKGFLKFVKKHRDNILTDESYLEFKSLMAHTIYDYYFENFECVVKSFIYRKNNKGKPKPKEDTGDMWTDFPY